jgi:hypothetical protein
VYRVIAIDIPTRVGQIDTYSFDWSLIAKEVNGVTVKIDKNGDGVSERTVVQDNEITAQELGYTSNNEGEGKVAICHRPPGNPGNSHTLYLPASAIQAHLAHGDTAAKCDNEKNGKGKGEGDKDKEDNSVYGGDQDRGDKGKDKKIEKQDREENGDSREKESSKTPPGQAKKKK